MASTTQLEDQGASPVIQHLFAPGVDVETMGKLGLGAPALAHERLFAGGMAIDYARQCRVDGADPITNETRIVFDKIQATLGRAGGDLSDIVKMTAFATSAEYVDEMWAAIDEVFVGRPKPKRITLIARIGGQCRVEIEITADLAKEA